MGNKSSNPTYDHLSNRQSLHNRKDTLKPTVNASSASSVSIQDKENLHINTSILKPRNEFSLLNPMFRPARRHSSLRLVIQENIPADFEGTSSPSSVYSDSAKASPDLRRRNSHMASRLHEIEKSLAEIEDRQASIGERLQKMKHDADVKAHNKLKDEHASKIGRGTFLGITKRRNSSMVASFDSSKSSLKEVRTSTNASHKMSLNVNFDTVGSEYIEGDDIKSNKNYSESSLLESDIMSNKESDTAARPESVSSRNNNQQPGRSSLFAELKSRKRYSESTELESDFGISENSSNTIMSNKSQYYS